MKVDDLLRVIYQEAIENDLPQIETRLQATCWDDVLQRDKDLYCTRVSKLLFLWLWDEAQIHQACMKVEQDTCEGMLPLFFDQYRQYRIGYIEDVLAKMSSQVEVEL